MLLVEHDQAQAGKRQEEGRTGADDQPGGVRAGQLGEQGLALGGRPGAVVEPGLGPGQLTGGLARERRGQGDLGREQQGRAAGGQAARGQAQVEERLARAGHAEDQPGLAGPGRERTGQLGQCRLLLRGQGAAGARRLLHARGGRRLEGRAQADEAAAQQLAQGAGGRRPEGGQEHGPGRRAALEQSLEHGQLALGSGAHGPGRVNCQADPGLLAALGDHLHVSGGEQPGQPGALGHGQA